MNLVKNRLKVFQENHLLKKYLSILRPSIFIILIFTFGCDHIQQEEKEALNEGRVKEPVFVLDTILERTSPESLDLTKHQLFIDTTRNSAFYEQLINWEAGTHDIDPISTYIQELNKISDYIKVDLGNFPKSFVRVHYWEDEFYLYNRCDGIDQRFELRDSAFIVYGPLEPDAETIKQLIKSDENGIEVILNSFIAKTPTALSNLEITASQFAHVYRLKYQNESYEKEEFIIPVSEIKKFDLLVNHCPNEKVEEFAPFQ